MLLNLKWRSVSQQAHLYAYHLSQCPSYAASHKASPATSDEDRLPELRRLFAREVKRNLFEAYLRPKQTVIKLISNSISSSSCPGGEGIQFSASPKGHHLLAYNSSRIYVIDVRGVEIEVKRELKILRRPAATCINDEGTTLVVLLTEMQVDVYDLKESPPKRSQSVILDNSPRALALSPCCSVLASAYAGGIEVSSLASTAIATDRRAVKCDAVDSLAFSFDGTQILGTTAHSSHPNTVILTAPYYDPGSHMADDNISALWTTSILFPNTSRDCSHAVLLQNGRYDEAAWTFTYDRSFETFRAVRIDDLRNGTTYFTGPIPSSTSQTKLIPCTLPAASYNGELVSAGFQGNEVWLYGVPEDLDAVPEGSNAGSSDSGSSTGGLNRRNSGPSIRSSPRSQESHEAARVPQWQILCDKFRNTFVGGRKIAELDGVNTVKWVTDFGASSPKERLVAAARGVMPPKLITEEDGIDFVDGGRITLIDFDYGLEDGKTTEVTIEVGTREPETLEEERRDIDTEVAIVRRRTVAQNRKGRSAVIRAATTTANRAPPLPSQPSSSRAEGEAEHDPLVPRRVGPLTRRTEQQDSISEETETQSIIEEQEALDAPYAHASPRSGPTLRRAATAAAVNRRLHPSAAAAGHVQYRRADGRAEHPHESDADNWVPPPPPYQKDDPGDVPVFLRHAATAAPPVPPVPPVPQIPPGANRNLQAPVQQPPPPQPPASWQQPGRSQTAAPDQRGLPPLSQPVSQHRRVPSDMTLPPSRSSEVPRPVSSQSRYLDGENIYDVSPPGSPSRLSHAAPARIPSDTRTVSGSTTGGSHGASHISPVSPGLSQRTFPAVPRIQTVNAPPQSSRVPVLDFDIPSATLSGGISTPYGTVPEPKRISKTNTWPTQPPGPGASSAMLPTGYPYSAPPTNFSGNQLFAQSLPPAPTAEQPASLNSRTDQPAHRVSGSFQLQRVPVGSRTSAEYTPSQSYQQSSPSQQQAQQPQQQAPQPQAEPGRQQDHLHHPAPGSHQPRPRREPPPPVEDTPLIISTPKGVSGAFDPPGRRTSGRRAETQILAPVPRHARATAQAAVLRPPPAERLDTTIYSTASGSGSGSGLAGYLVPPEQQQQQQGAVRVPSLNRRQSRAERSAAKNIADAKRRGWSGRRKSTKRQRKNNNRQRERADYDAASSAAWTDVTTASARSGGGGGGRSEMRDKKCVIM